MRPRVRPATLLPFGGRFGPRHQQLQQQRLTAGRRAWLAGLLLVLPLLLWWRSAVLHPRSPAPTPAPSSSPADAEVPAAERNPWAQPQEVAAAARYLHDVVLAPKARPRVPAKRYTLPPEPRDMRRQHAKVSAFLASRAFARRQAARKSSGGRGIIINAGGPQLLASAAVTLKVLRTVLNCTLPVELVWHSPSEVRPGTLEALAARWGPLHGIDLSAQPWPEHHRPPPALLQQQQQQQQQRGGPTSRREEDQGLPAERGGGKEAAFIRKVQSLTASRFASALLVDADNLPLANPAGLWDDATFKVTGNLFWPDFWRPFADAEKEDVACDLVGLKTQQAMSLLADGRGQLRSRGSESGQLLLDLVAHGDVAEWALWLNSFSDVMYRAVWGDKDLYALAFAVAGKAHAFNQLQVPPGGAFSWRPSSLLVRATNVTQDGWQLAGMVQFDATGNPAFLHRTMNKLSLQGETWLLGLLTGPLPSSWLDYYLAMDAVGPTVGVPVTYAAPTSAFGVWSLQPAALWLPQPQQQQQQEQEQQIQQQEQQQQQQHASRGASCPGAAFELYWHLRQRAVPLGTNASLEAACTPLLLQQLGSHAAAYTGAGLLQWPGLLAVAAPDDSSSLYGAIAAGSTRLLQPPPAGSRRAADDAATATATSGSSTSSTYPQPQPVPAWMLPPNLSHPPVPTAVTRVLAAANAALAWLRAHGRVELNL